MAHVKTNQMRAILLFMAVWLYTTGVVYSQYCIDSFSAPDTIRVTYPWGTCAWTDTQLKQHLGLGQCTNAGIRPEGTYVLNQSVTISVIDKRFGSIKGKFVFIPTPPRVDSLIVVPLAAGECRSDRQLLLDQLNAPADVIARSRVHFLQGTTRLESFKIGDTTHIDIACSNQTIYKNIRVAFIPQFATVSGSLIFDRGLTTCPLHIEEVINRLGYNLNECNRDRFTISHLGPFEYGVSRIAHILLDNHVIARNIDIEVYASNCPSVEIDYGLLPEGQCYLTEHDVIKSLGIDLHSCDIRTVRIEPAGPYLDTMTRINTVFINNKVVCSRGFDVRYRLGRDIVEIPPLYCNDELNVAMDATCSVLITGDMILQNRAYCFRNYWIDVQNILPGSPKISGYEVKIKVPGRYNVTITNPRTGVSCWSSINIEDKHIPDIVCTPDTVLCFNNNDLRPDMLGLGPKFPFIEQGAVYMADGETSYRITSGSPCGITSAVYADVVSQTCTNGFKSIIRRSWTFVDLAGNRDTCSQMIYVRNTNIDSIVNFAPFELSCLADVSAVDAKGHPAPSITGFPLLTNGQMVGICESMKATYEDLTWPLCGDGFRISRQWSIIDWCSQSIVTRTQTIRIQDSDVPVWVQKPSDMYLSSDPFICGQVNIRIPSPTVSDCDDQLSFEILYETSNYLGQKSTKSNGSSLVIPEINMVGVVDSFTITYVVRDRCGNTSRDSFQIKIRDEEPPVAVCDKFTTVSISGNGIAQIRAITFDDLSVDNCGIARYEARKLNGDCEIHTAFSENIRFCCGEVGDTIKVEFRVIDNAGNTNTCIVEVWVQDKFRPKLTCPNDITIDCGESLHNLSITGSADARDNCSIDTLYYVDLTSLSQCNSGIIERQWIARDKGGYEESCIQRITVQPKTSFVMKTADFPKDIVIEGCGALLLPEYTGSPTLPANACAQVDATFTDLIFDNVEFACRKILREWTVIDWCQLNDNDDKTIGIWKGIQVIKVVSTKGPQIPMSFMQNSYCIDDGDCFYNFSINPIITDEDNCTPRERIIVSHELYRLNPSRSILAKGETSRVDLRLPPGNYEMVLIAIDECNLQTTQKAMFTVVDCSPPVIACPSGAMIAQIGADGIGRINIADQNIFVLDNCESDISISFAKNSIVNTLEYPCSRLEGASFQLMKRTIYAWDDRGNMDSCQVTIELRDDARRCSPAGAMAQVAGAVLSEKYKGIQSANVSLMNASGMVKTGQTSISGQFGFDNILANQDYYLEFQKDGVPSDGVSTSDILLIQNHILGFKSFDSPYKLIASDADNNGRITGADIVRLKRIVLQMDTEFRNGQKPWRFVRMGQKFENIMSPFPFDETIQLRQLTGFTVGQDVMAIKIGDLNGSNSAYKSNQSSSRSIQYIEYNIDPKEPSNIIFSAPKEQLATSGIELHIRFDPHQVSIVDIVPGSMDISSDDFFVDDKLGIIHLSWITMNSIDIVKGSTLFTIKTSGHNTDKELFSLAPAMDAEWIKQITDVSSISLRFKEKHQESTTKESFSMFPNPFAEFANVQIYSSLGGNYDLRIMTLNGQLLKNLPLPLVAGENALSLSFNDIDYQGMILFELISPQNESQLLRALRIP